MTKVCRKCGVEKALSEFGKNGRIADGRRSTCKSCRNRQLREKRQSIAKTSSPSASAVVVNGKKGCSQCRKVLPVSHFSVHSGRDCGLQSRCKACEKVNYKTTLARERTVGPASVVIQKPRRFPPFKGYGLPECRGW